MCIPTGDTHITRDTIIKDRNRTGSYSEFHARRDHQTRDIQLFRERLSGKSTKVHTTRPKGSMGRSIELLHVLNTNEIERRDNAISSDMWEQGSYSHIKF